MCGAAARLRKYVNSGGLNLTKIQLIVWSFVKRLLIDFGGQSLFLGRQHFFDRRPGAALQDEIFQVEYCSHAISRSEQALSSFLNLLL